MNEGDDNFAASASGYVHFLMLENVSKGSHRLKPGILIRECGMAPITFTQDADRECDIESHHPVWRHKNG